MTDLHRILSQSKVIAVVGHSDKPDRTSYKIAQYLRRAGYTVFPVNPVVSQIDGQRSYASLADVPEPVDIVNVFRRSEHLQGVVEDAIAVGAPVVWAQHGVYDGEAAQMATAAGLEIVMDTCIKIAHARLMF